MIETYMRLMELESNQRVSLEIVANRNGPGFYGYIWVIRSRYSNRDFETGICLTVKEVIAELERSCEEYLISLEE